MKISLLLSGQINNRFKECFDSVKQYLLDVYDVDVFISTWESEHLDDILRLYNPKYCRVENYNSNGFKIRYNNFFYYLNSNNPPKIERPLISSYPMWYKIYDVNNLRKDYEIIKKFKYDVVIRSRFDVDFNARQVNIDKSLLSCEGLDLNEIEDVMNNDVVYLRKDEYKPEGRPYRFEEWIWDTFAFGNSKVMDIYCGTFLNLEELVLMDPNVNEIMLLNQLKNHNIPTKQTKTLYGVRRSTQ